MQKFMGGDHDKAMMILEGSFNQQGELIAGENIKVEKIEQNINDKMFESYEQSTQNSIRKAFNAIPQILIDYEDSKLGTTSGEALRQASEFYNQQTIEPRMRIEQIFSELFKYWIDPNLRNKNWTIKPLILGKQDKIVDNKTDVQTTALNGAQITSLLEIVNAVAAGNLPILTAKAVIKTSFPDVSDDAIEQIMVGLIGFVPKTTP
jgi:hypothetical protein